jgi:hypothetical protein
MSKLVASGDSCHNALSEREQYEIAKMNAAMHNRHVFQACAQQDYAKQTGMGLLSVSAMGAIQGNSYLEVKPQFGVLYSGKEPLPDDWAGAKITSYKREPRETGWLITFVSKWDSGLRIQLWLDLEAVNGTEAHTIAATYMEALNQRRVG